MAVTEQVIIEFITNDDQLKSSEQRLTDLGKIDKTVGESFKTTNTEINKQAVALKTVAAATSQIDSAGKATKKNIQDVSTAVKGMSSAFQKEFKAGVIDELKKAGVSLKDFEKQSGLAFGNTEQATLSLRSQLRQMVEQLAQLKVQGKDTGAEYIALAQKAGQLKDAIADANQQVSGFGSDTRNIDGLIQGVSGLAGGFAVVQGATALFGDESEELQKTLLRVNAAMAILQGLQQIQNVLQKESAASQLANTIATKAQAAALAVYNFVIGTSTGLLKLFRIALAATGIGLLVIGILELVKALQSSNDELEDANELIDTQKRLLEGLNETIQRSTDLEVARLQAAGAAQSAVLAAQGRSLLRQREAVAQQQKDLVAQRDALGRTSSAWFELNKQIDINSNLLKGLDNDIVIAGINFEAQLAQERDDAAKKRIDDAKKYAEDQKRLAEEARQREKDFRAAGFADFKAGVELELLAAEKGSQEELEIRKRLLRAELQQALDNEKLTANQRKLLVQQFFKERIDLEKQFAKDRDKVILENINADIQAELQGLELSNERRLELTETGLQIQAQLEIDAAEGNAAKIAEINAKRDKAIRDARLASIQATLDYELSLTAVSNAAHVRALQVELNAEKTTEQERIAIINELARINSDAVQKRIDALNEEKRKGLISQKDYNLQYAQLVDQQTQIWEDAEQKKTDATKKATEERNARTKEELGNIVKVAEAVSNVLSGIFSITSDKENQRLQQARADIKDLQEAGAITEKEAVARMKRLDAEEKKIKQQQAQRDKALALFNAVISTAKGIAEAIPNPFLIALAAAIGAAQIAVIAARPIPKFGKGKKGQYEGLAEVGETGPELIQRNGRMEVASKRSITWLSKNDKVFNPMETAAMLSIPKMNTERTVVNNTVKNGVHIDYDKLGQAVGKHVKTDVYVDGVQAQHIEKMMFENYLNGKRNL